MLLLFFASFFVQGQSRIMVNVGTLNPTVAQVMGAIESQTSYSFTYDENFNTQRVVRLSESKNSVTQLMTHLVEATGREYMILNNSILIKAPRVVESPKQEPVSTMQREEPQPTIERTTRLSGRVVDATSQEPLAMVSVKVVSDREHSVFTQLSGEFEIEAIPQGEISVEVSHPDYYRYSSKTVLSRGNESVIFSLEPKPNMRVVPIEGSYLLHENGVATNVSTERLLQKSSRASKQKTPWFAIKTNLLYDMTASISLGAEFRVGKKLTLELPVTYNPWTYSENKKAKLFMVQPELRFWGHEPFNRHFFGVNLLYAVYNTGGLDLPFGMWPSLKDSRYEGHLYGGGVTVGHSWIISNRFNLEGTLGVGYFYSDYKKYDCPTCGDKLKRGTKHYFGPTKIGLSLVFIIK